MNTQNTKNSRSATFALAQWPLRLVIVLVLSLTASVMNAVVVPAAAGATTANGSLELGDKGAEVADLQRGLVRHGYDIVVDGDFGNGTLNALKSFQRANGLVADGIAGPLTLARLNADSSSSAPPTGSSQSSCVGDACAGKSPTAMGCNDGAVSYTHLTLPTTPYV